MTPVRIRLFARADRDQLAALVNAHLGAVTPGASVSVQALLSQLEREPGEFIVDPWVRERITLVAEHRQRIVAAAHLLHYRGDDGVGDLYRDAGEIRWLVSTVPASFWPDADEAAAQLIQACMAQLGAWRVRVAYADGALPGPGVYGVPDAWPHIRRLYESAGFSGHRTETVLIARIDDILAQDVLDPGVRVRRTLGINGTRFTAFDGDEVAGYIEVESNLGDAGRFARGPGLADIGNLHANADAWLRGLPAWLLHLAARWLQLGGTDRLLTYLGDEDGQREAELYAQAGFTELTTTIRDYSLSGTAG